MKAQNQSLYYLNRASAAHLTFRTIIITLADASYFYIFVRFVKENRDLRIHVNLHRGNVKSQFLQKVQKILLKCLLL